MKTVSGATGDTGEVDPDTPAVRLRVAALTILAQQRLDQPLTPAAARQLLATHRGVDVALRAVAAHLAPPPRPRTPTPDSLSPPVSAPISDKPSYVIPAAEPRLLPQRPLPSLRAPVVQAMPPRQRRTPPAARVEMISVARPPLATRALGAFSLLVGVGLTALVLLADGVAIADRATVVIAVLVAVTQGWAHLRGASAARTSPPRAWRHTLHTYGIGLLLAVAWAVAFDISHLADDVLGASPIAAVVLGAYVVWLVLSTLRWGIAVWRG